MPNYRRLYIPGAWYFFTVVTFERRPILTTPIGLKSLRSAIESVRTRHPFETIAWVVIPDHLHCIWRLPDGDVRFSTRWRQIKTQFTREYIRNAGQSDVELSASRRIRREKGIWQRRFWEHFLRDEDDLRYHIEYIHYNPVKHRLVEDPSDWKYSSIHRTEYAGQPLRPVQDNPDARHLEGE